MERLNSGGRVVLAGSMALLLGIIYLPLWQNIAKHITIYTLPPS